MASIFDLLDPVRLTGYVRTAVADREESTHRLVSALPTRETDDIEAEFLSGGLGTSDAAVYRTFDAESPIADKPSMNLTKVKLPPISLKSRLGEYERLASQNAGEDAVRKVVERDASSLARSVADRIELARSEALRTGKIVFAENGVYFTLDYGRTNTHSFSASVAWGTTASAVPLTDFRSGRTKIRASGGEPNAIVMNDSTYAKLMATDEIKKAGSPSGSAIPVSDAAVSSILGVYGFPLITVYSAVVKVNGSSQKVVPDDRVYMYDTDQLGDVFTGRTAEQLTARELINLPGGIVATNWTTPDPVAGWTKASAIALPVLANPNISVCIDVS